MATAVTPQVDGPQTTKRVPHQPQVQRASLKQDSRYTRAHNGALDHAHPTTTTARRVERHSLRPLRAAGALDPSATITAKTPMKAKKPSQDSTGSAYGRTSNGRQFTVGNIGNGGRIYLRYMICPSTKVVCQSFPGALEEPLHYVRRNQCNAVCKAPRASKVRLTRSRIGPSFAPVTSVYMSRRPTLRSSFRQTPHQTAPVKNRARQTIHDDRQARSRRKACSLLCMRRRRRWWAGAARIASRSPVRKSQIGH
jgi:hypothetical protein